MSLRAFKYYSPLIVYLLAYMAFTYKGVYCYLPLLYAFGIIPLMELFLKPDPINLSMAEEGLIKNDRLYDWILYLIVCLQLPALFYFLQSMTGTGISIVDKIGRITSMGILCGVFGINVGHELGHRINKFEQRMAKILLMTSLYMHFFIEHNKGHHKNVATPEDPSSARFGESLYRFWQRTILFSYKSAWRIANTDCLKKGNRVNGLKNEMIQIHIIQLLLIGLIIILFGWAVLGYFLLAALMGILLLETVNYIEHYGLSRKKINDSTYERALPEHSWNSDHIIGRLMLFELSRHSDHHYMASRKYQLLRHFDQSPQMPTGYPGMMLLSLLPPFWFRVMHKRLKK